MEDFNLEGECCICGKYKLCAGRDEDLGGCLCPDCLPHVIMANKIIIQDLVYSGILDSYERL